MSDKSEIVIVSNRLPVHRVERDGGAGWETSPGGLVSAMTPILQDRPSTWIGWAGAADCSLEPFEHDGIRNCPVPLSTEEIANFYEGFSNSTLWPLYHDAIRTPSYHRHWWRPYREVNERFATIAAEVAAPNGIVWIHDYHFQLVPSILRTLRPDLKIGFFLHIPFPPEELFAQLPWRREMLEGLLGADVVGFQTKIGAQNFARLCRRYTEVTGTRDLDFKGRHVTIRAFPISIDFDRYESLARDPAVQQRAEAFKRQLGVNRRIVLGVDRMDYTKGIDIRIKAYGELLRSKRTTLQDSVFVQVAVPSRERVDEYQSLRDEVERLVGAINGTFGELGMAPIHYLHRSLPAEELVGLYLAADVMVVTPFRDGMNLVAKEYVASRIDEDGVLLLSEFTGSAHELKAALQVNPHDVDGLTNRMYAALTMSPTEQSRRMRRLRRIIRENTVYDWANTFFEALTA
ncbi:MAG: trehalose-6-phosphate synthase [Phycisphaerales bacterium]|nr:trehalose-6-phosphate synthase [Phycisphaerales bacterium]MCB9862633.1 trehalose-6-phosphate synthase [Phycisphaerales bacterium]